MSAGGGLLSGRLLRSCHRVSHEKSGGLALFYMVSIVSRYSANWEDKILLI
jgi:hypothetical protein